MPFTSTSQNTGNLTSKNGVRRSGCSQACWRQKLCVHLDVTFVHTYVLSFLTSSILQVTLCAYKQWRLQKKLSVDIADALGDLAADEKSEISLWGRALRVLRLRKDADVRYFLPV